MAVLRIHWMLLLAAVRMRVLGERDVTCHAPPSPLALASVLHLG